MRLASSTSVEAVDLDTLILALPPFLAGLRALTIDQHGVILPDGDRREGLRLVEGAHPRAGARYELVVDVEREPDLTEADHLELGALAQEASDVAEAQAAWFAERRDRLATEGGMVVDQRRSTVHLVTDDRDRSEVEVTVDGPPVVTTVLALDRPDTPGPLTFTVTTTPAKGCLVGGPVVVEGSVELADGARWRRRPHRLRVEVRHRRAQASLRVDVTDVGAGRWDLRVKVRAVGRGVVRPVVAVASLVGRGVVRRGFAEAMAELPDGFSAAARELRAEVGPDADPDAVAAELLRETLALITETVEDGPTDG